MRPIAVLFLLFGMISGNLRAQSSTGWKLIFEDEFEGSSFDTQSWSYCKRGTPDWNKYLVSSPQTVQVENGVLKVRAIKNTNTAADPAPYLTGGIESRGKFNFKYGRAEIRAKFDNGQGSWPAIWMMPENNIGGWPAGGEIDIMEHLNADNLIYQTVHSTYTYTAGYKNNPPSTKTVPINKDDWNVYGFNWYPDRIEFTLNGSITYTYPRIETSVAGQWPFDKEFYFILNMAAGGSWGGPVTDSHLPFEMQVDWVRVYQPENEFPYSIPDWNSSKTPNDIYWQHTYLQSIAVNGAETAYRYTASQRPASYYSLLADTLKVYPDKPFELSAEAFSLGAYSTSVVKQDLRYTCAYIFADFDGDRYFETTLPRVGKIPPADSKGENMETLSVQASMQSKSNHLNKTGRIRLIYHNAWFNRADASSPVYEGLVYDIPLRTIAVKTSTSDILLPEKISRAGNILTITNAMSSTLIIFDLTGKQIHNELINDNLKELSVPGHLLILQIIRPDGSSASQLI